MFTIYTKPDCNYCVRAKDLLNMKGEPFLEIDISENVDAKERLKSRGFKTVPQIFVGEKHIGGYSDLTQYIEETIESSR